MTTQCRDLVLAKVEAEVSKLAELAMRPTMSSSEKTTTQFQTELGSLPITTANSSSMIQWKEMK
jgi:hypothetical protein